MQLPRFGGIGLNRSTARLLVLSAFYILFLVLGAAIFSAIEGPEEAQRVRQLRQLRKKFLQDHEYVSGEYWLSSLLSTADDILVPSALPWYTGNRCVFWKHSYDGVSKIFRTVAAIYTAVVSRSTGRW
jgi:hypothetical protein